jgi:hypothetical protein
LTDAEDFFAPCILEQEMRSIWRVQNGQLQISFAADELLREPLCGRFDQLNAGSI